MHCLSRVGRNARKQSNSAICCETHKYGRRGEEGTLPGIVSTKNRNKLLFSLICLGLAAAVLCGVLFAFFSDRSGEQSQTGGAGTVIVELIEEAPFDTAADSQFIDQKTFCGKSTGTLDAYIRAYLKPVVEAYDETTDEWILIPVSGNSIVLAITQSPPEQGHEWVGADASGAAVMSLSDAKFFYYTKIMKTGEKTTDLHVQIVDIHMPEQFLNMKIRYNLHVFLEGAQVKNSLWRRIFSIESLPAGVES